MLTDKSGAKTQLSQSSSEFAQLEYNLQLGLNSSTCRILNAFALSNPHLTLQFEKRCKDILVLPAWVDVSELCGINTEEDVIRRGFQFAPNQQGIKFTVGSLKENNSGVRKAFLCHIGVGRGFVASNIQAERDAVPPGYDSFYVHDPTLANEKNGYDHEYYIKNPSQIIPRYLVSFEWDQDKEKNARERNLCDYCEEEYATLYCSSDNAYFCNRCDGVAHQSKITSRHTRTQVGEGSNVFGNCRHHPDRAIEFFCSQCHVPVCVVCKMVGNHANGEAAKHQLVNVLDAYQTVLKESQNVFISNHGWILFFKHVAVTS